VSEGADSDRDPFGPDVVEGRARRGRPKLLAAAERFCAVHAYRDAARVGRRALELWPAGHDEAGRLVAFERPVIVAGPPPCLTCYT
jgi:hypothetical protein